MFVALADTRRRESGILLGDAFDEAARQSALRSDARSNERRGDRTAQSPNRGDCPLSAHVRRRGSWPTSSPASGSGFD